MRYTLTLSLSLEGRGNFICKEQWRFGEIVETHCVCLHTGLPSKCTEFNTPCVEYRQFYCFFTILLQLLIFARYGKLIEINKFPFIYGAGMNIAYYSSVCIRVEIYADAYRLREAVTGLRGKRVGTSEKTLWRRKDDE